MRVLACHYGIRKEEILNMLMKFNAVMEKWGDDYFIYTKNSDFNKQLFEELSTLNPLPVPRENANINAFCICIGGAEVYEKIINLLSVKHKIKEEVAESITV